MQRFFINVRNGRDLIEDPDGSLLPNVDAARNEALSAARDILASRLRGNEAIGLECFEITDESGVVHATVALTDAIKLV